MTTRWKNLEFGYHPSYWGLGFTCGVLGHLFDDRLALFFNLNIGPCHVLYSTEEDSW